MSFNGFWWNRLPSWSVTCLERWCFPELQIINQQTTIVSLYICRVWWKSVCHLWKIAPNGPNGNVDFTWWMVEMIDGLPSNCVSLCRFREVPFILMQPIPIYSVDISENDIDLFLFIYIWPYIHWTPRAQKTIVWGISPCFLEGLISSNNESLRFVLHLSVQIISNYDPFIKSTDLCLLHPIAIPIPWLKTRTGLKHMGHWGAVPSQLAHGAILLDVARWKWMGWRISMLVTKELKGYEINSCFFKRGTWLISPN